MQLSMPQGGHGPCEQPQCRPDTRESGRGGLEIQGLVGLGQDQGGRVKVKRLKRCWAPGIWLEKTKPC